MNKPYKRWLFSLLSGLLLFISWVPSYFVFCIFFAFIPLFFISDYIENKKLALPFVKGFIYSYPAMLIWNVSTTWWIWNSTPPGAIAAFILNALLMSLVFGCWQWLRRQNIGYKFIAPLFFVVTWISFEFLHLHWDLSWPWLNLGNIFASFTKYVQWYEFTGTFGGTLWILVANFLFYYWIKSIKKSKKEKTIFTIVSLAWLVIPIAISFVQYYTYHPKQQNPIEAVIVQQNTDPWAEQYYMANIQHAERLLEVAFPYITPQTELIVSSESSIPHTLSLTTFKSRKYPNNFDLYNPYAGFVLIDSFLHRHPNLNIIAGLSTEEIFPNKVNSTAHLLPDGRYQIMYNSAVCYNKSGISGLYHKSKLVPGVEKMPFPKIFGFLENLIIDLGGPNGSLGIDSFQRIFATTILNGNCKMGVPICYESIFGELFANFALNGANLMAVITNDAWWGETPGHKQHFLYAKLRAVETRRTILRAANTGISGVIDERGDIQQKTAYGVRTALRTTVYPNNHLTFYTFNGDYIARISLLIFVITILYTFFLKFRNLLKKKNKLKE